MKKPTMLERVVKSFLQGAAASLAVSQVAAAVSSKNLSLLLTIGLTALGGAIAAAVSVVKNGFPVPAAKITMRPRSRWRLARRRM